MIKKKKILMVFGTRPEALKFVPVIKAIEKSSRLRGIVCLTGQHRQMLDQVIKLFKIRVDADLNLMRRNQKLEELSASVLRQFSRYLKDISPDLVMVQGDTSTAFIAGLTAFYAKIPVAHLEAGLRTGDKYQPFPEEINRRLLSHLADIHFTPTPRAGKNLVSEGIEPSSIYRVGNTVVDTIRLALPLLKKKYPVFEPIDFKRRVLFMTAHRRESFGPGLKAVFSAIQKITDRVKDLEIVYPVHLNPNVSGPAKNLLLGSKRIHLLRPLTYEETLWIMRQSTLILTDSGGIQEEAPTLRKPVLVLRNVTERPEGVSAGVARLVGTDTGRICREVLRLLNSEADYKRMQARHNPYGDGRSAERIVQILTQITRHYD